mmetsp:Transcript_90209/g.263815  ORF Transcript_90209/g.263815 Transcript_90209/m.263815 type:complete len:388 (-) Transcript_90209:303-1466(-)
MGAVVKEPLSWPTGQSGEGSDNDESTSVGSLSLPSGICVGTMQWGNTSIDRFFFGPTLPDSQLDGVVASALSRGIAFFDSAEGYGGGTSELRLAASCERVGKELGADGPRPVIATKFLPTIWRYTKASFMASLDASLRRLGTPVIDLYFIHSPVHPLPIERWVGFACDAVEAGKVREIGVSNCNADEVCRAVAVASARGLSIAANQIMYNLLTYSSPALQETKKVCAELGVRLMCYAPVGQGLLVEDLQPERLPHIKLTRMTRVTWDELQPLRTALRSIAQAHAKTMAQVALNWTLCHGHVALVGCKRTGHVDDACAALGWRLSPSEQATLDSLALNRSTLAKPRARRFVFMVLLSGLVAAYRFEIWLRSMVKSVCSLASGLVRRAT